MCLLPFVQVPAKFEWEGSNVFNFLDLQIFNGPRTNSPKSQSMFCAFNSGLPAPPESKRKKIFTLFLKSVYTVERALAL